MDAIQIALISAGAGAAGALCSMLTLYFARSGFRANVLDRCSSAENMAKQAVESVAALENDVRDGAKKLEEDIRELHSRTSATLANINLLRETCARDFVDRPTLSEMEKRIVDSNRHSEQAISSSLNHMTERLDRFIVSKIGDIK